MESPLFSSFDLERVAKMLTREFGVHVIVGGSECKTNGSTIWLPDLPPGMANDRIISLIRYFLDHECGHLVGKTEWALSGKWKQRGDTDGFFILETLEDVRCESIMSSRLAGCGINLRSGASIVNETLEEKAKAKDPNVLHPLKQMTVAAYLHGRGIAIPDWIDAKIMQVLAPYLPRIKAIPSTASRTSDLEPLATELMQAYRALTGEKPQPQPQQQGGNGKPEKSNGNQKGKPNPVGGSGKDKSQGKGTADPSATPDASGKNKEVNDGDDNQGIEGDGSEGDASESGSGSEADDQAGDSNGSSESDSPRAGGNAGDANADNGSSADASGGDGGAEDCAASPTAGEAGNNANTTGSHQAVPFMPVDKAAPLPANLADNINSELKEELAEQQEVVMTTEPFAAIKYDPHRIEWQDASAHGAAAASEFIDMVKEAGGPMRQKLSQLLMAEARIAVQTGLKRGSPDPRKLAALVSKTSNRVMRKFVETASPDTACCLLVDLSGSMCGRQAVTAAAAAAVFAQVLDGCGHKSMVCGFRSGGHSPAFHQALSDHIRAVPQSGHTIEGCMLIKAKTYNETFRQAAPKLSHLANYASGGTPLASAMLTVGRELMGRREKRRVLMVFTDGSPNNEGADSVTLRMTPQQRAKAVKAKAINPELSAGQQFVKHISKKLEKMGVEVVLIGINTDCVNSMHFRHAVCGDLASLGKVTMIQLTKALNAGVHI